MLATILLGRFTARMDRGRLHSASEKPIAHVGGDEQSPTS